MENFNVAYCTLCNSEHTNLMQELIEDSFDGKDYQYYENYMQCENCGFEFVTSEQSTSNLVARMNGEQAAHANVISVHNVSSKEAFILAKKFLSSYPHQDKDKYASIMEILTQDVKPIGSDAFYRFKLSEIGIVKATKQTKDAIDCSYQESHCLGEYTIAW